MRSYVMKFLVLCLVASQHSIIGADDPTTEEDYQGYVRAQQIFQEAFDFSTEEVKIENPRLNPKVDYRWENVSWVMGLRGRDNWGKWVRTAECNAIMVQPRVATVPCSCIWSWYLSFGGAGNFTPAADRTKLDLTSPELFLFHTYHPPNLGEKDPPSNYFKWEVTRYYAVINEPLESYECDEGINNKTDKQLDGVALVELDTPVFEGKGIPVAVPLIYDGNDYSKVTESSTWNWHVQIAPYGIQFADSNTLFVPEYALPDYNKKHERWRAWTNFDNRLRNELVSLQIRPRFDKCRPEYLWRDEFKYDKECWRANSDHKEYCNILPGTPVMSNQLKLYGMIMNWNPCPSIGNDTFFEVKRFSDKKEDVIKNLLKVYDERIRIPLLANREHDKSQILFNKTLGRIFYDEDLDPSLLYKIKNNISFEPGPLGDDSKKSGASSVHITFVIILVSLFSFYNII